MFCDNIERFAACLADLGYCVHCAGDKSEALSLALDLIGSGTVGVGGSVTVSRDLELPKALAARGNTVYDHAGCKSPEERMNVFSKANAADWYVTSANAITQDGRLVNTDGNGNRVAAMLYGPKNVLMIIGKNKLTESLESACRRIKEVAAPMNAKRLSLNTPCAATGICVGCHSPDRICGMTVILDRKPRLIGSFHIILVDEELGY